MGGNAYRCGMEVTALVRWLTPDEGGWSELPAGGGPEFFGVAQLTDKGVGETHGEHFSVALSWEGNASSADAMPSRVRTFIDDAFSSAGQKFVMMDGPRPLAIGEVVSLS